MDNPDKLDTVTELYVRGESIAPRNSPSTITHIHLSWRVTLEMEMVFVGYISPHKVGYNYTLTIVATHSGRHVGVL